MSFNIDNIIKNIKQKPLLVYGLCSVAFLPLSFFIVYYFRVLKEPQWLTQLPFTILLYGILMIIFTSVFFLLKQYSKNPPLVLSIIIFILCLIFALTTPVNQVPDENLHFLRAECMAQGQFGFDENHEYPKDTIALMQSFPGAYINGYSFSVAQRYQTYFELISDENYNPETIENLNFQIFAYIPQTIGIAVSNIIGFGAMGSFYFGRIFNILFFCICAYFTFLYCGKFKIILFTVICIPISLFVISSNSSDSVLFALFFLAIGCLLSDNFNLKKLLIFAFCMAILVISKATYIVFLPLIFAIPKQTYNVKIKNKVISKPLIFAFVAFISAMFYSFITLYIQAFSNFGVIERTMNGTDPAAQLQFILQNPLRYFVLFTDEMINKSFYLFSSGLFGWIDADVPIISNFTVIFVVVIIIKQSYIFKKQDFSITLSLFVAALLTYAVVATGMYLSWAPVTLIAIIGLQMRYFIPAFIGFTMCFGYYFSKFIKPNVKNTDISCIGSMVCLNVFAAILNMSLYYMM